MVLILLLVCAFSIWLYLSYVDVSKKRDILLDEYENVINEIEKRDVLLDDIITFSQNNIETMKDLIEYIIRLRTEIKNLGIKTEFINRRIAFENELELKATSLIEFIKEQQLAADNSITNVIKSYDDFSIILANKKQEYNKAAGFLRKAVDVFPTSFLARLNNIKSADYMK